MWSYQWCDHIILVYIEEMYLDIFSWKLLFRESTCIVFWYDDWYDNIIQCIYWAVLSNWGQLCIALQRVNMYFDVIISCVYFRNTNLQLNIIWQKFKIYPKFLRWYDNDDMITPVPLVAPPAPLKCHITYPYHIICHIIVFCFYWYGDMILKGNHHIIPSYPKSRRRRTLQGAIDLTAPPQVKRRKVS